MEMFAPPLKVGSLSDAEITAFLAQPWNGRLATVTSRGTPYVVPVWYEYDPGHRAFYVVGRRRAWRTIFMPNTRA
jgi:nitroimidazol reductase NimA-like FMN-containing flavoprotein (pyridoxamine 5'-phosphate oxidase superfamily)